MNEQTEQGQKPVEAVEHDDALISRLALIEQQPLAERATAYLQLHDELSGILEGSDAPGGRSR